MSTYNLGKVRGEEGTVNGENELTLQAESNAGLNFSQNEDAISVSMDTLNRVQTKLSGSPAYVVGFDENGDTVPVPIGYELYGFELDMDESYGPNMINYIAQNVGFEPAHMDYENGVFDYGDWANVWFIKNLRPCMLRYNGTVAYDLKKDDYSLRVDGVTASDVANASFDGNAMVGLPTVWVKVDTTAARKPKFYFSNVQIDGSYKAYAHHDDDGNIMPYTYMPIYNGWVDGNSRLRSISGKAPTAYMNTKGQAIAARANNPNGFAGWDIEKFVDRQLINLLLLLIGKSTDTQTVFGYGNGKGSATPATGAGASGVLPTGTLDDKGSFYGYSDDPGNLAVKVFGMENYWGNGWRRHMGLLMSDGTMYYKLTKDTSDGSTVSTFDLSTTEYSSGVPSGWIPIGTIDGVEGGIIDMNVGEFGLIGKTTGGDYDSKYYDRLNKQTTGNRVMMAGGHTWNAAGCGALACNLDTSADGTNAVGLSAPSCKPSATPPYYGFQLNMDESIGSRMITYLGKNANYTPAHMDYTTGKFDYGDWANAWFIKNLRPCMLNYNGTVAYDLNKNNYAFKVDGATASDVANANFAGNAMVGIPTVWIKVDTKIPRKPRFYFADYQVDSSWHAYAHHDDNGNIMPYTYMPIYAGYKDSSNRLRSISGVAPTGNLTGTNFITYARNNNPSGFTGWDMEKFCDRQLINLLLLLIGKTTDSQAAFGCGNTRGYDNPATGADSMGILPTGTLNDKGMFYGYDESTNPNRNLAVKVFGIENWWGNIWRRTLGVALSNNKYYYKLTKGTEDGSFVVGFNISDIQDNSTGLQTKWIDGGAGPARGGGIKDMSVGDFGLLPNYCVGGSDAYNSKYYDIYDAITALGPYVATFGGGMRDLATAGSMFGPFACEFYRVLSASSAAVGAAPSCKPNV